MLERAADLTIAVAAGPVSTRRQGPAPMTLKLAGEYDIARKGELARLLEPLAQSDPAIVDATELSYVDSSAIACIVSLQTRMTRDGRSVRIRFMNLQPQIRRIFALCGLEQIVDFT